MWALLGLKWAFSLFDYVARIHFKMSSHFGAGDSESKTSHSRKKVSVLQEAFPIAKVTAPTFEKNLVALGDEILN